MAADSPDLVDEFFERPFGLFPCQSDDPTSAMPGDHHGERHDADQQRQPAPCTRFVRFAATNIRSISSRMPPPTATSRAVRPIGCGRSRGTAAG